MSATVPDSAVPDIVVVSDLHLGRGKHPDTGRFDRLETFFYDEDFHHFCASLVADAAARETPLKLVLNGDTFDLLRLEPDSDPQSGERPRFAPAFTPERAASTLRRIVEGHRQFIRGLADVLTAGHQVIFIAGNHDVELQWEVAQAEVRAAILTAVRVTLTAKSEARSGRSPSRREGSRDSDNDNDVAGESSGDDDADVEQMVTDCDRRLTFEPWFHLEPGRIWIEHGCQYDPENAFRYQLRRRFVDLPEQTLEAEIDLPLGTFFQRYLYNSFGSITFIVPTSRSNFRYFRWLVLNRPRLVARIFTRHLPFFYQVLRRVAKSQPSEEPLRQRHQAEMDDLCASSPLGDRLREIDKLKRDVGSASIVAREILMRSLKAGGYTLLGAFIAGALWFVGFHSISTMAGGFGFKAVLFLTLNFLFLICSIGGLAYFLLRPAETEFDPLPRQSAGAIADLAGVPMVTFGHTHDEVIARLPRRGEEPGWYFNTGTWIAVFTADSLLPRERVQYTFLRVRGHRGELMHWSPGRKEASPVVLLEEDRDQPDRPSVAAAS